MSNISKIYENTVSRKTSIFTMTIPYRFQTEILIVKLIQNQKGRSKAEPLQNPTNLDKTMAKKQNELISILG
jgi:hypothetical protein